MADQQPHLYIISHCHKAAIVFALWTIMLSPAALSQTTDTAARSGRDNAFWQQYLELWTSQSETENLPDEWQEVMERLMKEPININDTTGTRLLEIPFLTPQHLVTLKAYIEQTGALFSVGELRMVPGFDNTTIRLIAPFVICGPPEHSKVPPIKQMLTQGHTNIVAGTHRTLELQRGYRNEKYAGDPFRYYLRYCYHYKDHMELQLSADQDPGEAFAWDSLQHGFDFYGFHLMLQNMGRLQRAIAGRYQLQIGQGLTLWSGFAPWNSSDGNLWRYGQGIRPASAFCEYGMLQGAAATMDVSRHLEATAFFSYVNRDATLRRDTANGNDPIISSIYNSGYHRTQTELDKRSQLRETLLGANLRYHIERFSIGATAFRVSYNRDIIPRQNYYNMHYFRGSENIAMGMDASYHLHNWLFFAEASHNAGGGFAQIAGMELQTGNNGRITLALRHFDTLYVNNFATPFSFNSSAQNESGLFVSGRTLLTGDINAVLTINVAHFPLPKYQIQETSNAAQLLLWLSKDFLRGNIGLQYRWRSKAKSTDNGAATETHQTSQHVAQLFLSMQPDERWSFFTRADISLYSAGREVSSAASLEKGILIRQTVTYHAPWQHMPLTLTGTLAYFNAQDYNVRLYAMESDFLYEMGQVMYYGHGWRASMLARWSLAGNVTLGIKYACMLYPGVDHLSSGYTQIDANHRQELKAQIRITF